MTAVILTIHTLIVLGLIGVVLLQRSEGGALGMGGAGSGGGFMSGRAAANALTRTTSVLAALFFATSLGLAITADTGAGDEQAIEELT
ncbi:MAG: preprotein translocase subunit SecG, partial [Marinicaulis sp.]|nr:preprotein translocase subunit SecG [Marinicaulis sp.]